MIRFGERVTLTNGATATLRDFHDSIGAFLEFDTPIMRCIRRTGELLGLGDRAWMKAPGWKAAHDRDGAKTGMIYVA
ncbi:MAG: hypothetical protein ABFC88_13105 [Thermoguttaceae bacterium]